jgi:glutamyl-Q tRNA(Asp) synthetase
MSPNPQYRGRFAPSPTGPLHAGSLATALGSWLHAKAHDGTWLLRIEDLDLPRCVAGSDLLIIQQLSACGLRWDEEIEYQSKRSSFYESALNQLIKNQRAYGCRCTRKQIEDQLLLLGKKKGRHEELVYPGTCRHIMEKSEPCAWRLMVDDPEIEATVGDFVLRRADRIFTYQMAVVVDDHIQGITHVVRGMDLLDNTPRQRYLQQQLNYSSPEYHHIPLVLDDNLEKLSKQTNAVSVRTNSAEQALEALQSAARHLELSDPSLFKDYFSVNEVTIRQWLEVAIDDYRKRLATSR